ncbi:MAG TPA: CAAX prenyl protease-related protein [Bryobacteraceae bacterium]|nr:CAAX prenyl protease-related protein [Bryobacteraceae bacterium]
MRSSSLPYVVPFVSFLLFLAIEGKLALAPEVEYPFRVLILSAILWFFSRPVIGLSVRNWLGSIAIGLLTFIIWIAPDLLVPTWHDSWLFRNSFTGSAPTPAEGYASLPLIAAIFRIVRAVILVPIIEELFWRAWLMRWIIKPDFASLPLGSYTPQSFWITAALFAAEHGAYWDVGLAAGIIYNYWMIRTRSLGDCILAHAVTNGVLCAYVLATGKWQYW